MSFLYFLRGYVHIKLYFFTFPVLYMHDIRYMYVRILKAYQTTLKLTPNNRLIAIRLTLVKPSQQITLKLSPTLLEWPDC